MTAPRRKLDNTCWSRVKHALSAVGVMLAVAAGGFAEDAWAAPELSGTLKKIKESGSLTLAVRDASSPFSFLDDKQQYAGYSIDLCMKIVDALKSELRMPNLRVNMTSVTSQTRIPLMANGTVDLDCGSTSNTVERQKRVGFLVTTFLTGTRLLVKKSSNIKSYKDLKGKTVVVTNGTTNERVIKELDARENLGMNFIQGKEHSESFLNVESGHAVAFPMDSVLLYAFRANAKNPAEYDVVGDFLSDDPYAIMVRKDDPAFRQMANNAVIALMRSGEIKAIYRKWFESPIPPKGVNLNMPMSDALKELIQSPSDKGAGACNHIKC
jgi:glutamate/aspartate transport system substrate-binding protein